MVRPTIKSMRHNIVFCSARDEAENGKLYVGRDKIFETKGSIEPRLTSMFSKAGRAILEEKNRTTHVITIWNRPSLNITSAAWIYETFRKSAPRWFKVMGEAELSEDFKYLKINVNLAERGDDVMKPMEENSFSPRIQKVTGL